jgi:hypothetical protein
MTPLGAPRETSPAPGIAFSAKAVVRHPAPLLLLSHLEAGDGENHDVTTTSTAWWWPRMLDG